jgi:uncharacterized protein with FMN-binding domain
MIKKILLSATVLGVFIVYSIHIKTDVEATPVVAIKSPALSGIEPTFTPNPQAISTGPTPAPLATIVPTATPRGKYKDGSYTGAVADAFYGNIQVQAIISGGKITDVVFLQYPNDRRTSIEINTQAMPYLKQEAIQAQSARVAGVSGATASSDAFVQSLGSALQKAI